MKYLLSLVLVAMHLVCIAQTHDDVRHFDEVPLKTEHIDTNKIYMAPDILPKFGVGPTDWSDYLRANMKYPVSKMEGRVTVSFVVERDGSITDVKVLRKFADDYDQEALRLVKASPKWKPGTIKNQSVRCLYNYPIRFALNSQSPVQAGH